MEPTMRLTELRNYVERQPFSPFRICLSDGTEHEVPSPNLIFLTKNTVTLCRMTEGDEFPETKKLFDPLHITRVEVMDPEPPAA